ncbi:hypothetical protein FB451DRAFT_1359065 [Mycena latifolia]|nr:hypothetical protein FB451DRAFT_1359065 [Mycena latifolia]
MGGFVQGSGHGMLVPALGLGVDRALQFKIVTPDGVYRTANACQNEDLFFAAVHALPSASSPRIYALHGRRRDLRRRARSDRPRRARGARAGRRRHLGREGPCAHHSALSVHHGHHIRLGGRMVGRLRHARARLIRDAAPLERRGGRVHGAAHCARGEEGVEGAMVMVMEFPTFLPFFTSFTGGNAGAVKVGYSVSHTSWLVARASFASESSRRTELVDALMAASGTPLMLIQITAPTAASVTPAWRDTVYPVTSMGMWGWSATAADVRGVYERTSTSWTL